MRVETNNRVAREEERMELAVMKKQQGEGYLDSCTSCLGENGEIPCENYLECVLQFVCGCGERICQLIEDLKDLFWSCVEKICPAPKEDEAALVTAFLDKWSRVDHSSLNQEEDEMGSEWRAEVEKLPRIPLRFGDAALASAHKKELYADTLERLGSVGSLTNLESAVGNWVEDRIASPHFIAGLSRWNSAGAKERETMPPLLTDQEMCGCFTEYWSSDRFAQKNVKKAWVISYDMLPEVVKDKVREAFFAVHTEITITLPEMEEESEEYRKAIRRKEQDRHIRADVANPTVLKVVRQWKT